jgi:hypothetical protein
MCETRMTLLRTIIVLVCASFACAVEAVATPSVTAPPLDAAQSQFAEVLHMAVRPDGVDYAAIRATPAALDRYRVQLAVAKPPTDRSERLALFINAYNAQTLALVVSKLPADRAAWTTWSITDAGSSFSSVWKTYSFVIAGRRYTLDELEHSVLRPMGEPRIHVAINCASRSCPPLAGEPYRAATIDAQLEAAARAFAASTYHLRLESGVLRINPILDWFGEDFQASGGVRAFLRARVPAGPVADYLAGDGALKTFDYDWRLNLAGATP